MLRLTMPKFVCATVLLMLLSFGAQSARSESTKPIRIAVYRLDGIGMDNRVMRIIEASLLSEVRKLERSSAISMDEVRTLLEFEGSRQLAGCTDEASCMAEIAESLGADALIIGGVTRTDDRVTISLKRVSLETASVMHAYTKQLTFKNGEESLAAVGPAVEALFPDLKLRSGQTRGVAPQVALRLNPPPLPAALFWTGAAATGALTIATVTTGVLLFDAYNTLQNGFQTAQTSSFPAAVAKERQARVELTNWVFIGVVATTAIVTVATAFLAPFTDFDDVGSEQ